MQIDEATAYILHERSILLAIEAADRSAEKFEGQSNEISRDALFAISQDAVVVHRSVRTVVEVGWGPAGAVLVRTLIDLLVSAAAIVYSGNPNLAAFKYFYSSFRQLSRDSGLDLEFRRAARQQVRSRVDSFPEELRTEAVDFLKGKDRAYWFSDEFRSPGDLLDRLAVDDFRKVYRMFSAAAHGGFLGVRLFRDDPDGRTINPQKPLGNRTLSLLLSSGRLLAEVTALRDRHEALGMAEGIQRYREQLRGYAVAGFE